MDHGNINVSSKLENNYQDNFDAGDIVRNSYQEKLVD